MDTIAMAITNAILLLIMLVGLFRVRHNYGLLGLGCFLWKQVWCPRFPLDAVVPIH